MESNRVRENSKILLGSSYRLEVAAAVAQAEPGVVHVRGLADQLALKDNLVSLEIGHFERAGLLVRLPKPKGQQQQDYERMPSVFWEMSRALHQELGLTSPSRVETNAGQSGMRP
jgi:predicted transcriptional regulator